MKVKEISFALPIGYEDMNGQLHRNGKMKLATALDEIEIHSNPKSVLHKRYRDCLILAQVITELGELTSVGPEVVENLYEVDFLYLQILYNKLNQEYEETIETECPECHNIDKIFLPDLYKELHHYFSKRDDKGAKSEATFQEIKK